jgi:hypothetical protein
MSTQGGCHLRSDVLEDVSALQVLDRAVYDLLPRRRVDGRRCLLSGGAGCAGHEDGRDEKAGESGSDDMRHW